MSLVLNPDIDPPLTDILLISKIPDSRVLFHAKLRNLLLSLVDKIISVVLEDLIIPDRSTVSTNRFKILLALLLFPFVLINFPELIATVAFPI